LLTLVVLVVSIAVAGFVYQSKGTNSAVAEPVSNEFSAIKPVERSADLATLPERVRQQIQIIRTGYELRNPGEPAVLEGLSQVETPQGQSIVLAKVSETVCAFLENSLSTCADQALAADGRAFAAAPVGCATYKVLGLMPDGVAAVEVGAESKYQERVPVFSNAYVATLPAEKLTLRALDESGAVAFGIGLPLNEYAALNPSCDSEVR
jgi:hypothetical protein